MNSDLANILGNLVQRTISMAHKYFDGKVSNKKEYQDIDYKLIDSINSLDMKVTEKMDSFHIADAVSEIFDLLRETNKYIDETTPWTLAKDSSNMNRLETVIYNLLESIRVCGIYLSPFIPDTSDNIIKQLNNYNDTFKYVEDNNYQVNDPVPLFMRIDVKKDK